MSDQTANWGLSGATNDASVPVALERLFSRIGEISSLPDVAIEIIEIASDTEHGAADLLDAVRRDPALSMRLMRTVNSSYYALRAKVTNLKQAINILGVEEVRNLALTAFVAPLFKQTAGYRIYTRRGLWQHMVTAGMLARLVARVSGKVPAGEAYLAGLVHDVGHLLIDQYMNAWFCRIIDALPTERPICQIETELLGFDHATLGAFVAAKWGLPEYLSTAISGHHQTEDYDGPHRTLVSVAVVANFLCHYQGVSSLGAPSGQSTPMQALRHLGLSKEQLTEIVAEIPAVLETAETLAAVQMH